MPFLRRFMTAVLFACAMVAAHSAEAATVYVQPPTLEGADAELRSSLAELVRASVAEESGYTLVSSAKDADFVLQSRLIKLGTSYVVSVDKLKKDKLVYTTKMKAANADDLDTVSSRIVRSVLRETKAQEDTQVGEVTRDEETQNTRRIQTTRQWKIGFGPSWGDNMNTSASGMNFNLGFVWGLDPNFDLDLGFRSTGFTKDNESGSSFTEFMIGTNYYFSRARHAPYVSGGLGYVWATSSIRDSNTLLNTSDDKYNGWGGRLGLGYKFFRTSTVNLGVEVNYSKAFGITSRSSNVPGVTAFALSLYY